MMQVVDVSSPKLPRERSGIACAYGVECLTNAGTNLFINGVAFYMARQYGWSAHASLLLIMAQGLVYTFGALMAGRLVKVLDKPQALMVVQVGLWLLLMPLAVANSLWIVVPALCAGSMVSAMIWPIIESLITEGCDARTMSRRITFFNLIWSIGGALVIAAYGTLMYYWPRGPMVVPLILQTLSLVLVVAFLRLRGRGAGSRGHQAASHAAVTPDAALVKMRTLALWLARISLPACFVVGNTLMGLFATQPAAIEMGVKLSTFIASLWMVSRVGVFFLLGATTWWQTRPRLLLVAAVVLLLAFLGIVIPADRLGPFVHSSLITIVALMAVSELLMGIAAGFIYTGSLYYGMVLSDGSTEQGGYHEALIGAGIVVGPGFAAAALQVSTDGSQVPGIAAVTTVMLVTIAAAGWISLRLGRPVPGPKNRHAD